MPENLLCFGDNANFLRDRHQFEYWALGLISARPAKENRKKGADKGIDGSFSPTPTARIPAASAHPSASSARH